MIGLFINTLPVRIQLIGEMPLISWLRRIQIEHAEVRDYEYAPLLKVQQWSELPSGVPLFDTHQIFENYPVDDSLGSLPVIPLLARDFRSFTRANFPVSLVSAVLDEELSLKILYDSASIEASFADRLLDQIHSLIAGFVSHPQSTVGELSSLLAEMDRQAREEDARELETASRRLLARATRRPRGPVEESR
jgi:non-ribosomal peptide synthetase component F